MVAQGAEAGARVAVFPEMMLTGYPVEDLALRASFVDASVAALHDLAEQLGADGLGDLAVVVGYLDRHTGVAPRTGLPRRRAASTRRRSSTRVVSPSCSAKHHLPNYGVFDEARYFIPGDTLPVFRARGGAVAAVPAPYGRHRRNRRQLRQRPQRCP